MANDLPFRSALKTQHLSWLKTLTALPTAAGQEHAVWKFVRQWAKRRAWVNLTQDAAGNGLIQRQGIKPHPKPIIIVAHMDHPAMVVQSVTQDTDTANAWQAQAQFLGGIKPEFAQIDTPIHIYRNGKVIASAKVAAVDFDSKDRQQQFITLQGKKDQANHTVKPSDIARWAFDPPGIIDGQLHTDACDNLASVAAGLILLDQLYQLKVESDVRLLLTRAEEVGFVGAISACKLQTIPKGSRIVVLENSKASSEAPLGGGVVVRVGDRTTTFDLALTGQFADLAQKRAEDQPAFRWMRRLMQGGSCEATAFAAFGFKATCLCLPLHNYHNMDEANQCMGREAIDLNDFACLLDLLIQFCAEQSAKPSAKPAVPSMRTRLSKHHSKLKSLLDQPLD